MRASRPAYSAVTRSSGKSSPSSSDRSRTGIASGRPGGGHGHDAALQDAGEVHRAQLVDGAGQPVDAVLGDGDAGPAAERVELVVAGRLQPVGQDEHLVADGLLKRARGAGRLEQQVVHELPLGDVLGVGGRRGGPRRLAGQGARVEVLEQPLPRLAGVHRLRARPLALPDVAGIRKQRGDRGTVGRRIGGAHDVRLEAGVVGEQHPLRPRGRGRRRRPGWRASQPRSRSCWRRTDRSRGRRRRRPRRVAAPRGAGGRAHGRVPGTAL